MFRCNACKLHEMKLFYKSLKEKNKWLNYTPDKKGKKIGSPEVSMYSFSLSTYR